MPFTKSFIVVAILLGLTSTVQAASGDADGTYTVTVTRLEFRNATTGDYLTMFEGSRGINIASASAGATAASLASGGGIPQGTYDQVRVTLDGTLSVRGYVNSDTAPVTFFTNGGTDAAAFSTNVAGINTPGATYAIASFTIPAAQRVFTQNVSFTIGSNVPTVRVTFDTSGVLTSGGGVPSLGAPSVTMTAV